MRRATLAATTIVLAVLVAGCSHGNKSASSSAGGGAVQGQDAAGGVAAGDAARAPGNAVPNLPGVASGSSGNTTSASVPLAGKAVIRTANITVETNDVSVQADKAVQLADAVGGDVTGDLRSDGTGAKATADITLAVPPASLESVLRQLATLGKELSRQTTSQDVTTEVADVSSRVASAQASIARLQTLYGKANAIADVIALEGELSQREADLESLEAQQRSLTAQTALAVLTLHLQGTGAPSPAHKAAGGGFTGGLSRGWHTFLSAAGATLTVLGAALPFAVLFGLVGGAVVVIRRRIRPAVPAAPAE